ncbi:SWR1 complex subunit 2 isoform X1 [Arachis ipaensis]|uniref:SWR1 complex subunit 2 isoform X1 n=1 Tax=Arachis ipaensis TaxID=130454 RepID=UPI000A2B8598|nr:SWR1 complex subunit 2 isoform X1 [Arachis ipaensis]
MESSEPAPPVVLLDRASRATRGKRMTKLLDDEIQQDDLFWNQDALKDEEEDDNYVEEAEVADEFDSDFNDEESEPDDQPDNDIADERVHKKKRLIFPGKKLPKPKKSKKKQKVLSKLERSPNDDDDDDDEDNDDDDDDKPEKEPVPEEHHDTRDDGGEKIIRKSTRTAVIVRQAERDAIRALQASMKPQTVKKKKEGEEKRMTQEEMLLEAAQTEIMNLRNLERVLAREEEVKRKAIVHKTVYNGPQIRYISKDGYTYLEFIKGSSFHSDIATTPVQCTVIQRQGCHMPLKKLLKKSDNGLRRKMLTIESKWPWGSCMIQFLVVVFRLSRRDQWCQTKVYIQILGHMPASEECLLPKTKILTSFFVLLHVSGWTLDWLNYSTPGFKVWLSLQRTMYLLTLFSP